MKEKTLTLKPVSDYILIVPDKPSGGKFDVGDTYIDETGIVENTGSGVTPDIQKLRGRRIIFNAWACDAKTVQGKKYYFAPESANAICAVLN